MPPSSPEQPRPTGSPVDRNSAERSVETLLERIALLEQAVVTAEETNEARATFLATMSHELREPMNGVLGMARLLRETALDREQRSYVEAVVDSAEALISIINDILDLSRIDAGSMEIAEVDFALRPFFTRLGALLESRATRKGIAFRIELDDTLPTVLRGDPGRLRQMLVNLAGNAIKFTSEGEVVIRARAVPPADGTGHLLALSVSDTGAGIPEHVQERLFSAFAQADAGIPRVYGGSGLGLMIAQRLARAMGGDIGVCSDGRHGSRFDLTVRLASASGEDAVSMPRADLAGAALLVADAQERSRNNIVDLAGMWNMHARGATSEADALSAVQDAADRGEPFEFVIVDRSIEEGDDHDIGKRIRAIPGMEQSRLVLLVASGMRGDAQRAREAGFDAYLPKPLTASTLLDGLQQLRAGQADGGLLTIHSIADHKRKPLRILVADDNPVNCKLATIMLQRSGHTVELAANGEEAVRKVTAERFDLVLMDIQMPVMNGLDATRRIRELEDASRASVPIIAITANAMRGDDAPCYEAGMNGYITKPIDRASLLGAIENLL
ncbi:MAG: response regulator [Geminicoccaceae bacterium]